ncbi:putative 3-beta-hydroxysteroid-4-alpha-carboxylate 3-dehydrogenase (decarboxylating) [Helianthus annuus]|nr:putative 3-beta-hydroxysteroid-4-alpha-carboxylate 3-dehydrogenase (decarboxylating) [Helianthus annuus]
MAHLSFSIEGSSVVFYVNDDSSCNHDFFSGYTIIVQGVKNVISACQECKVKRLIYNSTADVVLDNSHDIHNGNETLLYATTVRLHILILLYPICEDYTTSTSYK